MAVALTIRIDENLRDQVADAAQADSLSMNREIMWLLYAALYLRSQGKIQAATYVLTSGDD